MNMNTPSETRNIINHYWYWEHQAILADLDSKRHNFSILCCNLGQDFNISSTIRNANAFLAKEVIVWGSKQYDKRGAVGTHKYTHFKHFKELDLEQLKGYLAGKTIIGFDDDHRAVPLDEYEWPSNQCVMVFGQEQLGIPKEIKDICDHIVYIKQYGSVRSLNVAVASGIAMYDFCAKNKLPSV
jgi:tRNA G18 (ribose-2'-O)-methylase SpoU